MTDATPTEDATPAEQVSADELFESLTGFDEIAIAKAFGVELFALQEKPFLFMRAMVFILRRREGAKDPEAHHAAMAMTLGELTELFPEPEAELDPDAPETESGKDDSAPA